MKCQLCDGKGEYMHQCGGYRPCEYCNGTGKITLTREEYIRTCSTEELAKTLYDIRFDFQIPWKNKEIIGWLKEKHHDSVQG